MTKPHVRFLDRTTPPHIATLVIMAGMAALSMNLFLPALPTMAIHFETDYAVMQLAVAIFLAVNAALQLVVGPLADRYGRRPIVMLGFSIFLVASFAAIYAPTITAFLTLRAVQAGIVTGMVLSRAIVRDMVPGPEAASMIAYVTMGMSLVPMIAPWFGGVITAHFGWEANFWVMGISGAAVLALIYFDLGETAPKSSATSVRAMFKAFPELLRSQRFLGYSFSAAAASGAFFAYLGGGPFVGSQLFGLNESTLGIYMSTPALGYFFGNFFAGKYSIRIGANKMILIGSLILLFAVGANLVLFMAGYKTPEVFFGLMVILGFANGMQLPNAMAGSLSVRPDLAGTASGLSGTMMIGGGAALSALAGSLLTVEGGAMPLLWIMFAAAVASVIAILWVIRRDRILQDY